MIPDKLLQNHIARIQKFYDGLSERCYGECVILKAMLSRSSFPIPWSEREKGNFISVTEGDTWGKLWDSAWLHIHDDIPSEFAGKELVLRLNVGGEALLYDSAGKALYSLTNTSVFASCYRKEMFILPNGGINARADIDLWLEIGANGLLGAEAHLHTHPSCNIGYIEHLKLCVFNRDVWLLKLETEVLMGILNIPRPAGDCCYGAPGFLPRSRAYMEILMGLMEAIDAFANDTRNASKARQRLKKYLSRASSESAMRVAAIGHAHIDTGWLWPVRESIRKVARTFASQLYLMEHYPDYVFGASQALHYQFMKDYYPEIFHRVRQRVQEGRWELLGGMWVESDCNLVSGESLVRQFLYGKRFFLQEFGIEVKNLWLPDVFGYCANLPQIIRKASCDYFLTQKISWNQFNHFPHHAFNWRGIDGSEVLAFFPPEDNYNAQIVPDQLNYGADNLTENYQLDEFLSLYGIGDGGGGPKEEHLERARLCHDLNGSPRVDFSRADAFFQRLDERSSVLPSWHGELYLELHRGTLTTHARMKLLNRRLEQQLVNAEFLDTLLEDDEYPKKTLDDVWKILLLNQFHDILPGSSIHEVYVDAEPQMENALKTLAELQRHAAERIFQKDSQALTIVNTLSYPYTRLIQLPEDWRGYYLHDSTGKILQAQNGFVKCVIPPQGIVTLYRGKRIDATAEYPSEISLPIVLENEKIRYVVQNDGTISSAYDKELQREFIRESTVGNLLTLYADDPTANEAWDVDVDYERMAVENACSQKVYWIQNDEMRKAVGFKLTIGDSSVEMTLALEGTSKRLECICHIHWNEHRKMLRVAFPTTVQALDGTFDIPYGFVSRPAHRNTLADLAQFESSGQRYINISENGCGCALLNDCKYGQKICDGVLDMNLLRSPDWPDEYADIGEHDVTYAFLPNKGNLTSSNVMAEAAMLNRPCMLFTGLATDGRTCFPCRIDDGESAVSLEVLKRAEDSSKLAIRLVETTGNHSQCHLRFFSNVVLLPCDLVELHQTGDAIEAGQAVELTLSPFEIRTYLVAHAGEKSC